MRIRQQLLINWIMVILFSVITIGSISIWVTYKALRQANLSELQNVAKTIKITATAIIDISVQNYLRAVSEKNRDVVQFFYKKYQQNELTEAEAKKRIEEVILSHKIGKTGYNFVYDIRHAPEEVICAIHPKVPGLNVAQYDFGQTAFQLKNGYFEYQWKNPDEQEWAKKAMYVSYFEPWEWLIASSSYKREFVDLINHQELQKQLATVKMGERGYVFVLDKTGKLIFHPYMQGKNIIDLQDDQGNLFIQKMLKQKDGIIYYRWRDQNDNQFTEKVAVLNYIDEMEWVIGASIYQNDIFQPLYKLSYAIAFVAGITLLLGIVTIIFIINSLTKPLIQMTRNAQKLAEGNIICQIESDMLQRPDEVGDLARTFNMMMDKVELREHNLKQAEILLREYNATLEDKVKQRTEQLELANREIHLLNCHLEADNVRMAAELHITHRLQQMLLPNQNELIHINGLEIASFMQPADEVGGDYYDVLAHNEGVKIGIGDVTGHGLDSSVIMLMLQTAVRTLLTSDVRDTRDFLTILNRTIYDNLKRMDSDKNLTLSLLDYREDGVLILSGQHEELLLVRNSGRIERIDTIDLGFPIGIQRDIDKFIGYLEIKLEVGDGVVLYTDGITEARNSQRRQYGVERLCAVISAHWHSSVYTVKEMIINDLHAYTRGQKLLDDMTLIVLKRV